MGGQKPRCLRNRKCVTTKETVHSRQGNKHVILPIQKQSPSYPATHTHFRLFFQFGCVGFRCCSGFSLAAGGRDHSPAAVLRQGPLSSGSAQASHGVASLPAEHGHLDALKYCRSRLQSRGSTVVVGGLSCSVACRVFPDQGLNPCHLHWEAGSLQ